MSFIPCVGSWPVSNRVARYAAARQERRFTGLKCIRLNLFLAAICFLQVLWSFHVFCLISNPSSAKILQSETQLQK